MARLLQLRDVDTYYGEIHILSNGGNHVSPVIPLLSTYTRLRAPWLRGAKPRSAEWTDR